MNTATKAAKEILLDALRESRQPSRQISVPEFFEDIPNESWLKGKVDYAVQAPRSRFGVPKMGSTTGYFSAPVMIPVRWAKEVKGERAEQSNVRQHDLDAIRRIIRDTGKFPLMNSGKEYVPYIEIGYDGVPWVNEGNHRIMAAAAEGLDYIPVELRYFDGGQRLSGKWSPDNLIEITNRVRGELPPDEARLEWMKSFETRGESLTSKGLSLSLVLTQKYSNDDDDVYVGGSVSAFHKDKKIGEMPYGFGEEPVLQIGDMVVDKKYQRSGVGTAMLDFARSNGIPVQHHPDRSAMSEAGRAFASSYGESNLDVLDIVEKKTQDSDFMSWFSDSKIVDSDGRPLVVHSRAGLKKDIHPYQK